MSPEADAGASGRDGNRVVCQLSLTTAASDALSARPTSARVPRPRGSGFRITANALRRAIDRVWDALPKDMRVEGHTIHLLRKDLQLVDNPAPDDDQPD